MTACNYCDATHAPFLYRPPGLRSSLPRGWRGSYIRTCADCRDKAEERIKRNLG